MVLKPLIWFGAAVGAAALFVGIWVWHSLSADVITYEKVHAVPSTYHAFRKQNGSVIVITMDFREFYLVQAGHYAVLLNPPKKASTEELTFDPSSYEGTAVNEFNDDAQICRASGNNWVIWLADRTGRSEIVKLEVK